jgi:hypothetical protein
MAAQLEVCASSEAVLNNPQQPFGKTNGFVKGASP